MFQKAESARQNPFQIISPKIKMLGFSFFLTVCSRRYYPNENLFPLSFLVGKLEQLAFEYPTAAAPEQGWVVTLLNRDIGIPFEAIWHAYNDLFTSKVEVIL